MNSQLDNYIERLSAYIKSTGKTYKDHKATILSWFHKRLRDIAKKFPKKNLKKRFHSVIMKNDKKKADVILQELLFESESERQRESVKEFEVYLIQTKLLLWIFNNFKSVSGMCFI